MKLLFIGPLPEPVTGQSLATQVLLDSLRNEHDVTVVNLSKQSFRQGINSLGRIREVLSILGIVWRKQKSHDAVYLTVSESLSGNFKDLVIYALCRHRLDTMVIHLHGGAGLRELLRDPARFIAKVNRYFLRKIGAGIVLGPRLADIFADSIGSSRTFVVPNFAEDASFVNREEIARKFSNTSPTRLLFLSNLIPGKGFWELLRAYRQVGSERAGSFTLDFAGGFESEIDKSRFLAEVSETPGATYHGVVRGERKRELFSRAHVMCLPTYYPYEGQPISILEAYAAGCAVVTTDHSGIFDVFTPGSNGFEVRPRSTESLAACLRRIHGVPGSLMEIGVRNHDLALERFRASRYCREVENVINSVCSRKA